MVRVPQRTMENTADNLRRFPPRSKFNDEESTGVLRLMVEQERLLKKPINPVLNITSDKLKRLPPLGETSHDMRNTALDNASFESQRINRRPDSKEDIVLSRPTLLKGALGRPKIPEIYSTPKMARPRERERPRASYGRHTENHGRHNLNTEVIARDESIEEYNSSLTSKEIVGERPSNPTPFQDSKSAATNQESELRTTNSDGFEYESEDDLMHVEQKEEKYASYIN